MPRNRHCYGKGVKGNQRVALAITSHGIFICANDITPLVGSASCSNILSGSTIIAMPPGAVEGFGVRGQPIYWHQTQSNSILRRMSADSTGHLPEMFHFYGKTLPKLKFACKQVT
jgi:hypothetical protein